MPTPAPSASTLLYERRRRIGKQHEGTRERPKTREVCVYAVLLYVRRRRIGTRTPTSYTRKYVVVVSANNTRGERTSYRQTTRGNKHANANVVVVSANNTRGERTSANNTRERQRRRRIGKQHEGTPTSSSYRQTTRGANVRRIGKHVVSANNTREHACERQRRRRRRRIGKQHEGTRERPKTSASCARTQRTV